MNETEDLLRRDAEAREWLADPHRFFKAFSRTARRFQHTHPSARYRVMTFVGKPEEFIARRPIRVNVCGDTFPVRSWAEVLAAVVGAVATARPDLVAALSRAGLVPWMVNADPQLDLLEAFRQGLVTLTLPTVEEAFRAAQWLMLMAGVKLNEAVVQVDSYTDAEWRVRESEILAKRGEEKRVLKEIDMARRRWAEEHPDAAQPERGTFF